ncbi:hypothetical protein Adt_05414 [Abeliophyllum distichum]|uniref:Uncharacterized protein n=1 Tax=Abeliophyllum distichum TaxID=126358 RepID=A0ABD1V433_9LAMI
MNCGSESKVCHRFDPHVASTNSSASVENWQRPIDPDHAARPLGSSVRLSISNSWLEPLCRHPTLLQRTMALKKKVLKYLPRLTYATNNDNLSDCAICLAEFAVGDETPSASSVLSWLPRQMH